MYWLPLVIACALSLSFLIYAAYNAISLPREIGKPPSDHALRENFSLLGQIAVWMFAFSSLWYGVKRIKKKSPLFRNIARRIYQYHHWGGYIAVVLIVIHGTFFLLNDIENDNVKTGISAFILLITLAIYGLWLQKAPQPILRVYHRILGLLAAIIIAIHAGGIFFAALAGVLAIWLVFWWDGQRQLKQKSQ